jgi:hypothetical protein
MKKSRGCTKQPALRALAASGCTKEEDGTVFGARSSDDQLLLIRFGRSGVHVNAWSQGTKLESG